MSKVVFKVGDNVSTDIIYPGRYMATVHPSETPQFAFADDSNFNSKLINGEIPNGSFIIAGDNFGCGSSREQAASCLKSYEPVIIAKHIARIFLQNAVNLGLNILGAFMAALLFAVHPMHVESVACRIDVFKFVSPSVDFAAIPLLLRPAHLPVRFIDDGVGPHILGRFRGVNFLAFDKITTPNMWLASDSRGEKLLFTRLGSAAETIFTFHRLNSSLLVHHPYVIDRLNLKLHGALNSMV